MKKFNGAYAKHKTPLWMTGDHERGNKCHQTLSKEVAGIFLNFSQSCQNKMFSALTSDFKKAFQEDTNTESTHMTHLL